MTPQINAGELFDAAIAELEKLSADFETDDATRETAEKQITALRTKRQDKAFDSIVARGPDLQAFVSGLESVMDKAKTGGTGDKIKELSALAAQGRGLWEMYKGA